MRLSSLELHGFKSFPDKTLLQFEDGITAVVGPNGSGKSNIADAVRWVLGEQSSKTLRGGKMEDVIFGGTQNRSSVGYASVVLTIETSEGELEDYDDQIAIGRRLYRSGESEYRINGNIVRLRDVHELFMDTGLGRDGYSIIGQGRIAEIVSAKSTERREIFEEAAGIAKYRYRRTEAQRKLDAAQENLVRLYDILTELEDRVEPLRVQSEKAKKYLLLAGERKGLEISLWINSLDRLRVQMGEHQNKVLISKNDYQNLEKHGDQLEVQMSEVYEKMQQLVVAADERRHYIKKLQEELSESDAKTAVLKNDIFHNNQSAEKLKKDLQGVGEGGSQLAQVLESKERQQEENERLIEEAGKLIDDLAKAQQDSSQLMYEIQNNADGVFSRRSSLEQAVSKIKLEQAASESILVESSSRLEILQQAGSEHDSVVLEHRENIGDCERRIEEQKSTIQSLENTKTGYTLKRDSRKKKYEEIIAEKEKLARQIDQYRSRAKLLKDMEASMEGYYGSVKYILSQHKKGAVGGIHGAVSSLITTKPEYITAVETALGGGMQNIVVDNEASAKASIEMLRRSNTGRATFLPITSVKGTATNFSYLEKHHGFVGNASDLVECDGRYKGIMAQLLGRICVVDDLDTGSLIAKEAGYKFRIVTLDGQVINAGGSYTGGATSKSTGVLGRRHEIEKLEESAIVVEGEIRSIEPDIKESERELAALEATLTGAGAEIQNAQEELVRLGFSKEQMEKTLLQAEHNKNLAKEEISKLATRLVALREGNSTAEEFIKTNSTELETLRLESDELLAQRESLSQSAEQAGVLLSEERMKHFALIKDNETLSAELARLKEQAESSDAMSERFQQELEELEDKNASIDSSINQLETRKIELKEEISSHDTSIKEFMDERTGLEKSTTELRQEERELSTKREEVSKELTRLEERQHRMQEEYDSIIGKLWDEYELTRSTAQETALPLEDVERSQRRLTELRNQIRNLGSVNVDAVEEYAEVSERYEFLSAQVKDVEYSKNKLNGLIGELTAEMEELFRESFKQINYEFSHTFVELFGGGRGELIITDEVNILESGIEIRVQPPGKVIKNLSLLSGGEQSFVAIAIYFAILKVKPAPFVLLDEIEAALDDVNVVKFANYLRTMCDKTQFIAITHRRGTMEEADILYGVTMQEEGVSKLLELKVQEVESKLGMGAEL